jgi:uncharacterized protein YdeI (YjbR/CyaY-like superfamily)
MPFGRAGALPLPSMQSAVAQTLLSVRLPASHGAQTEVSVLVCATSEAIRYPPLRMEPTFFPTPARFRQWLARNHDKATELLVGFYKKDSGKQSITWPESVDEALCFGWIDGVRRRIDEVSYSIRFTPRKKTSTWSAINIARVAELTERGFMQPAGVRAFEYRRVEKSAIYAYENAPRSLDAVDEEAFRADAKAWEYFTHQAPSYQRVAIYWVLSAKKEETRERRLATLIEDSGAGRRIRAATLEPKKE